MPIKFGSALFSKLQKAYWNLPNVAGKPFLFAIEDFSSPASLTYSRAAFEHYVFGYEHDWYFDDHGSLIIIPQKIETHSWAGKEIPSGFFNQPDSENVSAILFSNSGTIAKFNRMGILGGFGSKRVLLIREGNRVDHDPNAVTPRSFRHIVNAPNYSETWTEGLDAFHNPRALIPLHPDSIPGAAHHFLEEDGKMFSVTPEWHPLASFTKHFAPVDVQSALQRLTTSGSGSSNAAE